jgi:hypothetical protein
LSSTASQLELSILRDRLGPNIDDGIQRFLRLQNLGLSTVGKGTALGLEDADLSEEYPQSSIRLLSTGQVVWTLQKTLCMVPQFAYKASVYPQTI